MMKILIGFVAFWSVMGSIIFGVSKIPPETCRAIFPYGLAFLGILILSPLYFFIGNEIKEWLDSRES